MSVYHIPDYKKSTSAIFTIGSSGNFREPQKKKIIIFCGFLQFMNGIVLMSPGMLKLITSYYLNIFICTQSEILQCCRILSSYI